MEITEVRIRLVNGNNEEKLRAFATLTFDNEFVVRDIKVIDGNKGMFVAMPSRKIMERCDRCGSKNPSRSCYCSECGNKISNEESHQHHEDGKMKTHVDVAHPITSQCRGKIHQAVIDAYIEATDKEKVAASEKVDA